MANCLKCGHHLKLTDWRPNCPNCGVNLVYYGMEERLLADADRAESEHAHFQKKIDRAKASYAGSKFAIARIVLTVLPLACLFLPWAKVHIFAPFIDITTNISAIKLFTKVSAMDFGGLFTIMGSKIVGNAFTFFFAAMVCMLLAAVISLFSLILLFLSCSPKGLARNITLSSLGLVLTGAAAYLFTNYSSSFTTIFPGAYTGNLNFGIFVLMAAFALVIGINAYIAKVGIEVKYKQTYIGGIPSEEYFAAKAAGIDVLSLQTHVSEDEAANAVEKALEEVSLAKAGVPAGTSDADLEARAEEAKEDK